jgi:hypothetical protein
MIVEVGSLAKERCTIFVQDFILNGQGHGEVGQQLAGFRYDPGFLRPFLNERNERCVTINTGRMAKSRDPLLKGAYVPERKTVKIDDLTRRGIFAPVWNATSLRKEEWIEMDRRVVMATRQRLRAWADLAAASRYGGFNAMGRLTLEYEAMSDPGEAIVDMDGLSEGRNDAPLFKLRSLPLPITHVDFSFSSRLLGVTRNGGSPLDMTMPEAAGRRVGEMVEKTTIGVETGLTFGTQATGITAHDLASTVFGYINYTNRLTKTNLTIPVSSPAASANPEVTVAEVLAMREQLYVAGFFGPFMLYHSTDWDVHMDNDYARLGGNNANMTLRDRLRGIEGIQDVRRLDYLTAALSHAYTLVMVSMTSETAEAVDGMGVTTIQWETRGGMQLNFKVMAIQVPRLKSDYSGNCGILHARTA